MALDRKEKRGLIAVIAIVAVLAAWYIATTFVMPYFARIEEKRLRAQAQAEQKIVGEGVSFSLEGYQDWIVGEGNSKAAEASLSELVNVAYGGTLTFCVEGSRLYKTASEMAEAEGFEGDKDDISEAFEDEPIGLVVDVSITNVDAHNSSYEASDTYFNMSNFNLQLGDKPSMVSFYYGCDSHVPEAEDDHLNYWSAVSIPVGETVHVRLAFLLAPASALDDLNAYAQIIPVYEEGDRLLLYYATLSYSGKTTVFSEDGAYIPYLVELSPEVM